MAGIQERRREYESRPDTVWDILKEGSARARETAAATMETVRTAMKLRYPIA
jgi:tryptophanyl-tRNA synthetase